MSDAFHSALNPAQTQREITPAGPGVRFAARLIRLRHSRGRMVYAMMLALLTGLVMSGPLDVLFSLLWLLTEGLSAPGYALRPGILCLSSTAVFGLLYAAVWLVTTLLALPLRALTEWLATFVFIGAVLRHYAPEVSEALPHWPLLLACASWLLNTVLQKSGLAHRPLPWLTRRHRTRFTLPLPPREAHSRLRAHPGRPHWDKGWAEIAEVAPGDDSLLRVEVRRRAGAQTLFVRYANERPGEGFRVAAMTANEAAPTMPGGETLRFSPQGSAETLVEVETCTPHTLSSLTSDPMEDRISDYWAHAAAQISGRPDGTFTGRLLRPAKPAPTKIA